MLFFLFSFATKFMLTTPTKRFVHPLDSVSVRWCEREGEKRHHCRSCRRYSWAYNIIIMLLRGLLRNTSSTSSLWMLALIVPQEKSQQTRQATYKRKHKHSHTNTSNGRLALVVVVVGWRTSGIRASSPMLVLLDGRQGCQTFSLEFACSRVQCVQCD